MCLRVGLSTYTSRRKVVIKGQGRGWVFIGESGLGRKLRGNSYLPTSWGVSGNLSTDLSSPSSHVTHIKLSALPHMTRSTTRTAILWSRSPKLANFQCSPSPLPRGLEAPLTSPGHFSCDHLPEPRTLHHQSHSTGHNPIIETLLRWNSWDKSN